MRGIALSGGTMPIFFAAALLALAQSPVSSDVGCILDSVPAEERSLLARDTLAQPRTPVTGRFDEAVGACALDRGWEADQAGTFAGWAAAIILRDDAAKQLSGAEVQVGAIDRWFAAQNVAVRTNPVLEEPVMETLMDALIERGTAEPVLEAQAETIGVYVGARIMIERAQRGLPLN